MWVTVSPQPGDSKEDSGTLALLPSNLLGPWHRPCSLPAVHVQHESQIPRHQPAAPRLQWQWPLGACPRANCPVFLHHRRTLRHQPLYRSLASFPQAARMRAPTAPLPASSRTARLLRGPHSTAAAVTLCPARSGHCYLCPIASSLALSLSACHSRGVGVTLSSCPSSASGLLGAKIPLPPPYPHRPGSRQLIFALISFVISRAGGGHAPSLPLPFAP